jgi:NAD(P)H-hydrate repair Nnr-like enzyme with NAD(P)H-hydrate dehydratase domain
MLAVYGGECGSLTLLGCDDDDGAVSSATSRLIEIPVTKGKVFLRIAQSGDPWGAAVAAVWLHARAGELLANDAGRGVLASEVAAALPCAMAEVLRA